MLQLSAEAPAQATLLHRARATDLNVRTTTQVLITATVLRHTKEVLPHRTTTDLQAVPDSAEDHQAQRPDQLAAEA